MNTIVTAVLYSSFFKAVAILVLGHTESFTINSEVVVAETVIVGSVPNTFLQTNGGNYGTSKENAGP